MKNRQRDELPLLLVDSETSVKDNAGVWPHLSERDGWEVPDGAKEDQVFVMVRCMETWLLADPDTLSCFFASGFKPQKIRELSNLEGLATVDVLKLLKSATAGCKKKVYAKGKVSFELLGQIRPASVEEACPHAARFLNALRELKSPCHTRPKRSGRRHD
jgi:hypothetical protein